MAISITWGTRVIHVPRADLSLVQASPEVRELNLNTFRMWLKDLEDDPEGMPFPDTHRHNTEVTLSGLVYARIIEIINGYTVEFEDGQYTINCVGANHNLSDVKVANQVSLIINNAAGLISNAQIEYSSFNGGVSLDQTNSTGRAISGTLFPTGTPQQPSNNLTDAILIASFRGFDTLFIIGNATFSTGDDISGYSIYGQSHAKSTILLEPSATASGVEIFDCTVSGTLDGSTVARNCYINGLNYVEGMVIECVLEGTIILSGTEAYFINCWSGLPDETDEPEIDMGGGGTDLNIKQHSGFIKIKNTNQNDEMHIDLVSGRVFIDSTISNGEVKIRGVGTYSDNSTGLTVVDVTGLINKELIADQVLDEQVSSHMLPGSFGHLLIKLLGMSQENFRIKDQVYDYIAGSYRLTEATICIYSSQQNCNNDQNPIESYSVSATYDLNGNCNSYRVTT